MRAKLLVVLLLASMALLWMRSVSSPRSSHGNGFVAAVKPAESKKPAAVEVDLLVSKSGEGDRPGPGMPESTLFEAAMSAMHAAQAEQSCLAGAGGSAESSKVAVHRWVDEAGIVHFSDQAPPDMASGYRRIEVDGLPAVTVNATGFDVNLPEYLVQRVTVDAQAIGRIFRDTLEVGGDPGLALNIEFIASGESYVRRVGNPLMAGSEGTYSSADRTIRIHLQDDAESNFLILRHEITHALIHERIGRLPTTINEGLAGYFERIAVSGLGAQVRLEESKRSIGDATVSTDGSAELVDLLARDGALFYATGRERRYRHAFALVAVLMGSPGGRAALGALLAAQRIGPCTPVDAGALLDARYPGGLAALAADWSSWLRDPPRSVQAF